MKQHNFPLKARHFAAALCASGLAILCHSAFAQNCVPPPSGLLSWWNGEGNTFDVMGTNNGTVLNGAGYGPGMVGEAFSFTGVYEAIDIGYATNLQIQNFSIEAWVRRFSSSVLTLDNNSAHDGGILSYGGAGYGFAIYNDNRLVLTKIYDSGAWSSRTITDTNFHHIAVTKTNSAVTFYIDGTNAGTASYNPGFTFSTHCNIGAIGDFQEESFYGAIDEVAAYNRALTSEEIQGIYLAGSAGKCAALTITVQPTNETVLVGGANTFTVSGFSSSPIHYQWLFDSKAISGATNSILAITNAQTTNAGTYSVIVANDSGRVISSNAVLTVITPVAITSPPTNAVATLGSPATFDVTASGSTPIFYQWALNGTNIATATNSTYAISSVGFGDIGLYTVVVRNIGSAATSAPVMLAFNPQITVNGQLGTNFVFTNTPSAQVKIGTIFSNATIFYTLDGSEPDATSMLYFGPVTISQSSVVRAIAFDQDFNSAESLAVNITFEQSCSPPPSGLMGWWPGEGNALDVTGTNSGTLLNGAGYAPGRVGQAFSFTNTLQAVDIGYATNIQLQDFTIEGWIKRSSASVVTLDQNSAHDGGILSYGGGGYGFLLYHDNHLLLSKIYTSGVTSAATITDTDFHHVAVTKTTSLVTFYIDGTNAGAANYNPGFSFSTHANIGAVGDFQEESFYGLIDDIAVYNRALSATEIQGINGAGSFGKCLGLAILKGPTNETGFFGGTNTFCVGAVGSPPLTYQWLFNNSIIDDATNSTLTITNAQATNEGSYSVIVYGGSGQTNSAVVTLDLVTAAVITAGPTNFPGVLGAPASFTVSTIGTKPLSFQWTFNGTNISNATNSSYIIPAMDFSNLGQYRVTVSNQWSAATSAPALLAFNPQVAVNGQIGTNLVFTNIPSVQIGISSLFTNATIFYTLDGSTPTPSSTLYAGPFALTQSAVVRATAYDQSFHVATSFPVYVTLLISNSLTVINAGGGNVTLIPAGGIYLNSSEVQVTAAPTNGWTFLRWSGAINSTNRLVFVRMTNNLQLQAVFGTPVTFSPPQNGSMQANPGLLAFPYASLLQVAALPNPGYYFALWGGDASSATNPFVMTITNPNPTIAALFEPLPAGRFSLVVVPNGNGSVGVNPQGNAFASNSMASISASTTGTNRFYYWTGSATSPFNPLSVRMNSNKVVTANFSGGKYLVQFAPGLASETNFQFSLSGAPLQSYEVDASSDFVDWSWFATVTNLTGAIPLSDSTTNAPQKFYRAILH